MWMNNCYQLIRYGKECCEAWMLRGFKDGVWEQLDVIGEDLENRENKARVEESSLILFNRNLPKWFGDPKFHLSHQSRLLQKDPSFYGEHFRNVPTNIPYIWPGPG